MIDRDLCTSITYGLDDIPDTFEGLKHFRDEFKTSIQGLKANGGWTAGQLATGLKIRGLKGMTRERWNDKITTMTMPPTDEDFIEFLEARTASKESESLAKYNPYNDSSSVKGQLQKAKDKKMLRVSQSHSNSSNVLQLVSQITLHIQVSYSPVPDFRSKE